MQPPCAYDITYMVERAVNAPLQLKTDTID
jgi:hypothetical protein